MKDGIQDERYARSACKARKKTNIMEQQEEVLAHFFVRRGKLPTKSFGQGNARGQRAS
jgi:hypothetical protein